MVNNECYDPKNFQEGKRLLLKGVGNIDFSESSSGEKSKAGSLFAVVIVFLIAGIVVSTPVSRRVTIRGDGGLCEVKTRATTVEQMLKENKIELGPYDHIEPEKECFLKDGTEVTITRAVPVKIHFGNNTFHHWTTKSRVIGVLGELPFYLEDNIEIEPEPRAFVYAGQDISVLLIDILTEVDIKEIPFNTVHQKDNTLEQGKTRVAQDGCSGIRRETYRVVYENGVERERELVKKEIIEEPRDKVIIAGTKPVREPIQIASRSGNRNDNSQSASSVFEGMASWYGSQFQGQSTASGERYDKNSYTAAHRTLPFGTKVRVTFLNTGRSTVVRINDRGPHIAGRVVDLSKAAAEEIGLIRAGVGKVKIEVLK